MESMNNNLENQYLLTQEEIEKANISNPAGYSAIDLSSEVCKQCDLVGRCCENECEVMDYKVNNPLISDYCSQCVAGHAGTCDYEPGTRACTAKSINSISFAVSTLYTNKVIKKAEKTILDMVGIEKVDINTDLGEYLPNNTLDKIFSFFISRLDRKVAKKPDIKVYCRILKDIIVGYISKDGRKLQFRVKKSGKYPWTKDEITTNLPVMDEEWLVNIIKTYSVYAGFGWVWEDKYKFNLLRNYSAPAVKENVYPPVNKSRVPKTIERKEIDDGRMSVSKILDTNTHLEQRGLEYYDVLLSRSRRSKEFRSMATDRPLPGRVDKNYYLLYRLLRVRLAFFASLSSCLEGDNN